MTIKPLRILAVGDICPGDHYFSLGHGTASRFLAGELQIALGHLNTTLANADIAFANLEGVLSHRSKHKDSVESRVFRGPPEFAQWLRKVGFTHVNIANNHLLQHGVEAATDTIEALISAGITPIGLRSKTPEWHCQPVFLDIDSTRVGILGYSSVTERYEPSQNIYADMQAWSTIENDIKQLQQHTDIVIVSLHAGDEGLLIPEPSLIATCEKFTNAGVHVLLGHHSHTFQGAQAGTDSLAIYSLGNFIFDMGWDSRFEIAALANIEIEPKSRKITHNFIDCAKGIKPITPPAPHAKSQSVDYEKILNAFDRQNQIKKNIFFLKNLLKGDTRLKLEFIQKKIKRAVR